MATCRILANIAITSSLLGFFSKLAASVNSAPCSPERLKPEALRKLDFFQTRGLVAVKAIMTIRSFDLLQPRSLAEASELLLKHRDEARPIAGGTTLGSVLTQRGGREQ